MGLIARPHQSIPQTQYNHNQIQKHKRNNSFTHPKTFYEHNTTTQHRKRPIRQRALKGRHSCIAQGEMRAKPDMEPWGNRKQQYYELRRSGTYLRKQIPPTDKYNTTSIMQRPHTTLRKEVPPLKGLNKCIPMINPGLAPWAMQEYRPVGALR